MTQWSDAGGYLFGSRWGKTPFANSISPNKTMEGISGAFIMPILVSTVFYQIGQYSEGKYALQMSLIDYVFIGSASGFFSILGDLNESFIKRCSNIKDSGTLIPGHGGIMDRLDSLALVVPFLYWFLKEYMAYKQSSEYDPNSILILKFMNL